MQEQTMQSQEIQKRYISLQAELPRFPSGSPSIGRTSSAGGGGASESRQYNAIVPRPIAQLAWGQNITLRCKTKDATVAEYALRDGNKPIGVAEHRTAVLTRSLPENRQGAFPTIAEREAEAAAVPFPDTVTTEAETSE